MKNPYKLTRKINIKAYQSDFTPGWAAFIDGKTKPFMKITLNVGSILAAMDWGAIERSDIPYVVAESLMHEIMHALEKWAGVEFSEERIEGLIAKYREHDAEVRE